MLPDFCPFGHNAIVDREDDRKSVIQQVIDYKYDE
jgi:hypothetical protein